MGADLAPLTVTTEQGRRVRVPRAASLSNGRSVARFTFKEICASDSAGSPMGASDYISISQVGDDLVRAGQCVGGSFGLFGSFLTDGLAKCVMAMEERMKRADQRLTPLRPLRFFFTFPSFSFFSFFFGVLF